MDVSPDNAIGPRLMRGSDAYAYAK